MMPRPLRAPIIERRYPATAETVTEARRELERLLARLRPACVDTLRLLVSEVVTNAIRHGPKEAGATIELSMGFEDDRVRVEVEDSGMGFFPPGDPAADGTSGWGLYLVDQLADRWGIISRGPTRVWFELDSCVRPEQRHPSSGWPGTVDASLVDSLRSAVVATDKDGFVARWNPESEALFGWTASQAIDSSLVTLLFGTGDEGADRLAGYIESASSWEGDWLARRRSGSTVHVHGAGAPVRDEGGALLGVVIAWSDIEDRKRVEGELEKRVAELRRSERNLRLITENSPIAVLAYDLDGQLLYSNEAVEELTGYSLDEVRARHYLDWVHPEDRAQAEERWRWVLAGGEVRDQEVRLVTKQGAIVWSLSSWGPLLDERGNRIGVQGRERDITNRKRTEVALQERDQQLRMALSAGGMGTWDWDVQQGRLRWSENLEEIHGLQRGSFSGTFDEFRWLIHPEDRDRVVDEIERAQGDGSDYRSEYRIVRPDGIARWLAATGQVFRDAGRAVRMAGVASDITDRKEAERGLSVQYAVSRALADAAAVEDAMPQLLEAVARSLAWELGTMWQVDLEAEVLRLRGGWCSPTSGADGFLRHCEEFQFQPGIGLPGRVWDSGQPAWIPDVVRDDNFPRAPFAEEADLHAAFGFPIILSDQILGVLEFFSTRIRQPDQALLDMMMAIGRQIGQFLERKQVEAAMVESEARKSAILESALEAIFSMREDGTIVELNPAAEQMFGIVRDDAVGRELATLIIPERLRRRHREALERYRRTGEGRLLGNRLEVSGLRSDGTEFPVELTVTRVQLPGPALFTGYIRDITDRKRTEELRSKLLASERAARAEAEVARERTAYLAEASIILASSLDVRRTLAQVARLTVPRLADWCSVEMVEPDGSLQSVAVTHVDPHKVALAREYRRRYPPDERPESGISRVIATGKAELYRDLSDELLEQQIDDPKRLELTRSLGVRSAMVVPLVVRGRSLGAISFASSESGRRFAQADLELARDLAHRAAVAIDNARLYEERSHVARTLQRSLLPERLPTIQGIEVAAFYQPAGLARTEVGGDFYDAFETAGGGWGFVIGDVCGKGAEAAALTGLARHALRTSAVHQTLPSGALRDLNHILQREEGDRFCTVVMGRLEQRGGAPNLTVASGGHPLPLVLRRDGSVESVGSPGTLLGIFPQVDLEDRTVELERGDSVVFYTDGLIDGRRAEPIDDAALDALLATCRDLDATATADIFRNAVVDPEGDSPDDIAILVLRVKP
jgi:PAS domain S-box-containing protein